MIAISKPRLTRRSRLTAVVLSALCLGLFAAPGNGCSFEDEGTVFTNLYEPDNFSAYAAGHIGVVQPSYWTRSLVVAFNYFNGHPLTADEQKQASEVDLYFQRGRDVFPAEQSYDDKPEPTPGWDAWITARHAASGPAFVSRVPANDAPGMYRGDDHQRQVERDPPGEQYSTFTNCLDDAFATAARTLQQRQHDHGKDSPEVLDWTRAQDAVFNDCPAGSDMPQPAPASAPLWLKQDRAYQIAAAHFYSLQFDDAIKAFNAIAADRSSPWSQTARYVVARTYIRKSALPSAELYATIPGGESLTAQQREQARQMVEESNKKIEAGRVANLALAEKQLDAILADPQASAIHSAASSLRGYVEIRLHPQQRASELASELSGPKRGPFFRQNLIDLTDLVDNSSGTGAPPLVSIPPPLVGQSSSGLILWMDLLGKLAEPSSVSTPDAPPRGVDSGRLSGLGAQQGLASQQWKTTHQLAWLVAALMLATPQTPDAAQLISDAKALPRNSPAYLTATYHRLRLQAAEPGMRDELSALLPGVRRDSDVSSENMFLALRARSSRTLDAFLTDAGRIPANAGPVASPDQAKDIPRPEGCKAETAAAFDFDAATVLNQRMPLRLLREASLSKSLAPNLRVDVAYATWARALLLDDKETVEAVAPTLVGCYASFEPLMKAYDAAATPEERHIATLFALMRFPTITPMVMQGSYIFSRFADYGQSSDGWWSGNTVYDDKVKSRLYVDRPMTEAELAKKPEVLGKPIITPEQLPSPPFLTPADEAEAEKQIARLAKLPGAGDYFAREALAWVKAHPDDRRNADLLGEATRALRNAPRSTDSTEYNHQMFLVLQKRYPDSEWAKKYKTWQ